MVLQPNSVKRALLRRPERCLAKRRGRNSEGEMVKGPRSDVGYRATEEEDAECNDSRKNQKKENEKERRGVTLNNH